jgi:hypothetical protein
MAEVDDVYMGFAGRAELHESLTKLLTLQRHLAAADGDEVRWCARLSECVARLGAAIAERVDDRPDARARLIADLRLLLPRVRDDRLHADLSTLLNWHEARLGHHHPSRSKE